MHTPSLLSTVLLLAPVALAQIEVTNTEEVDQASGVGNLGYGASGLAFGYSAGAGLNFTADSVGGGFNAGIPGESEGAFGGGWTLTNDNLTFGLGGVYAGQTISVAVFGDKATGNITITVNGKEISV